MHPKGKQSKNTESSAVFNGKDWLAIKAYSFGKSKLNQNLTSLGREAHIVSKSKSLQDMIIVGERYKTDENFGILDIKDLLLEIIVNLIIE